MTKIIVGDCSVEKITEQTASLPLTALYPDHHSSLSEEALPKEAELSIHSWLVRTPQQVIVIDTATGNGRQRDNKPLFHQLDTPYYPRLIACGVDPDEVSLVLMTHIHTDHVGWNTHKVNGQWQPLFPAARYVCSATELEACLADPQQQELFNDSLLPLIASGQLDTVNVSESPCFAGVLSYFPTPGHSIDHASLILRSAGQSAIFTGDVMHHPLQFRFPQWNSVFCENKPQAVDSRQKALEWATGHQALWFSSHFAGSSVGRVTRDQHQQYHWQEV